jgi:serine/threonine protein kinase
MGTLYLARDPALNRLLAIKVLTVRNPELLERFAREARSAASLKHHHIVTIYDVGEDHGSPFIAMEYVDGETLAELIRRKAPLTIDRKLELMLELCDGLGYAHRAGIIHRDIKPANLMIAVDGALKILDFGIARLLNEETMAGLTLAGALVGTPHYMSPEQIDGRRIDHRVDIFAVGLVCYELLTYTKAFPGDVPHTVLNKILFENPPPMYELLPDIDPELEEVVNRAIDKNPERRYQQLTILASDLSRVRDRLRTATSEPTVHLRTGAPLSLSEPDPSRPIPNLEAIARRRSEKLDTHLAEARKSFEEGRFDEAIQDCEMAILIEPNHTRALDLLRRAHQALEDDQIRGWLEEARTNLSQSALTAAAVLIDKALQLRPNLSEAQRLDALLQERRREQEHARERARIVRAAIDRAKANLADGAFEAALRSAAEALAFEADNGEAQALRERAAARLAERRQQELADRAQAAVSSARELAASGEHQKGLALLKAFSPPHPFVERTLNEIAAEAHRIEHERAERAAQAERLRGEAEVEAARLRAKAAAEAELRRADAERKELERLEEEYRREIERRTEIERLAESDRLAQEHEAADAEAAKPQGPPSSVLPEYEPAGDIPSVRRFGAHPDTHVDLMAIDSDEAVDSVSPAEFTAVSTGQPRSESPVPRPVTTTPQRRLLLIAASLAVLVLVAAGWRVMRTRSSSINPEILKTSDERAATSPALIPVTINAIPWANVRIVPKDGAHSAIEGITPFVVPLSKGEYTIEFRNDLFQPTSQSLTVTERPQSVTTAMPGANIDAIVGVLLGPPQ